MAVNKVDVNHGELDRQAERILGSAPAGDPPPGPGPADDPQPGQSTSDQSWHEMMPGLTTLAAILVFPQWGFTQEEQDAVSKAAADVLEHAFPGGMGGKFGCYARLFLVTTGITFARLDLETGKFPPMGPRVEKPVGPGTGSAAAGSPQIP